MDITAPIIPLATFFNIHFEGDSGFDYALLADYFYSSNFCELTDKKSRFSKTYSIFLTLDP
jgi:hypothetical protein